MNFANVKAITIPEGSVRSVSAGGKVLWQVKASYTNLISKATATPGGAEIFNAIGYKEDYRWSSSSKTESPYTNGRISGWIPVVSGATYRIRNFYISRPVNYTDGGYLIFCDGNGTISTQIIGRNNENYDEQTDTLLWREANSGWKYFRISGNKCSEVPIVTMNEEIP